MEHPMTRWFPIFLVAVVVACGSSATGEPDVLDSATPDVAVPDFLNVGDGFDTVGKPDCAECEAADVPAFETDGGPTCKTDFTPCSSNKDCCSGWCLPDQEGHEKCTIECVDECPDGWECKGINFGGDVIFLCHAQEQTLCHKTCQVDLDCGVGDHLCATVADQAFCLQDCSMGQACPEFYTCKDVTSVEGTAGKQCWPDSESCICDSSIDYATNPDHCGFCGHACAFDHAGRSCVESTCVMGDCEEGWVDLDKPSADHEKNGCEYECEKTSEVDVPDPDGVDANCDGIDGEWALAVLVDGDDPEAFDDGNTWGDVSSPFKSVGAALAFAKAQGKPHVYVSRGTYTEQIRLQDGISLFGGYNADLNWKRNLQTNKTILQWDGVSDGQVIGVLAISIASPTTFDGFSVLSGSNPAKGGSSFGMYLFHTSQYLAITHNRIVAGNGGDGQDGTQGEDGLAGEIGENGNMSCEYGGCFLCICTSSCELPPAGGSGLGFCENNGGAGGKGGGHDGNGEMGANAPGGAKGGAFGGAGQAGQNGENGQPGIAGQPGRGGFANGFIDDSGFWRAYDGEDGASGTKGWGGGGGGGGGGDTAGFLDLECYEYGASGGGGGAGGCPGTAGKKGTGAGGSFGLFVVDGQVTLTDNEISYRNGGRGGAGGKGGLAGKGGKGGTGGASDHAESGGGALGGIGGHGGDAGAGGPAGGGAGGSTFGVFLVGNANPTCQDNLFIQDGFPGEGGKGGDGSAQTKGANGASGDINQPSADCQP